ncbi:MAG: choice-of-anchor L domain-containing protein [Bacteroidales bacterium]|nr:choice-of-anchor L domain-containing protein [Bacteroidales bacterium]
MRKIVFLLTFQIIGLSVFSQITTRTDLNIVDLVTDTLINGCTSASNVTVNSGAYGYFAKGNSSFPFGSGIILASGPISNAEGPNTSGSLGGTLSSGSDPDLQMLIPTHSVKDATVLEFDFIPASDTVRFNYIFGSEEFPEYANSNYNDVFGFFLSGPGISGPYTNSAVNIAMLPNNQPVTIDNVHNYDYYIAYPTSGNTSAGSYNGAVQYDGNTIVLTAEYVVTACETYHIKLAIGDAGDSAYDSGVFIEAGSFISGASIDVVNNAQVGESGDLWEGCENYYVISRNEGDEAENDLVIQVGIDAASTATPGEPEEPGADYTPFPDEIIIPAGVMTDTIFYSAYNDGIEEGHETIIVSFYTACPCGNMSSAVYDTIWIYDAEFIKGGIQDVQSYFCGVDAPESINLVGSCNIDPAVDYFWSTGENTSTITVYPDVGATQYGLTMVDVCGNEVYDSITIRISDMAETSHEIVNPSCYNECDGYIIMTMEGEFSPFTYRYANSLYYYIEDSVHYSSSGAFGNLCPGTYKITVTDNIGCYKRYQYTLDNPPPIDLSPGILETDMKFCDHPGELILNAESNQLIPSFLWSNGQTTSSITVTPTAGDNIYWVKIFDNCGNYYQDEISVKYSDLSVQITTTPDMGTCDGTALLFASDGIWPYTYYWQTPLSSFGPSQTDLCFGYYDVLITDDIGCETTETVFIEEHNSVPQSFYDDIFTVFPNPSKDKFNIAYKKTDLRNIVINITDIKGSVVYKSQMLDPNTVISGLECGVYFVKLYHEKTLLAVQKLIITK